MCSSRARHSVAAVLLAAVLPGTALAHTRGACGQPMVLTEALAGPLSPGFAPQRALTEILRSEPRYVEFTLDGAQEVTIRTESESLDPALALYDSTGRLLEWDDDTGGALQALVAQALDPGTYCAQVRPATAAATEFERVVVLFEPGLPVAPPSACADPALTRDLGLGLAAPVSPVALDGMIEAPQGRADFRLSLAEPLSLGIDAASGALDTVLVLSDAAGTVLAENDDFSGSDSRLVQELPAGDYCVSVRGFSGEAGPFTLALSEAALVESSMPCGDPALTVPLRLSDLATGAEPLRMGGAISEATGQSWYSLALDAPAAVRLDVRSGQFDTVLRVLDSDGGLVSENDDGPGGTDSQLDLALGAGDYCVVVSGFGGAAGAFELAVARPDQPGEAPDPATAGAIEDLGVLGDVARSYTISDTPTLWASFTLEADAALVVQGVSVSSEFTLALFAEDGTPLGSAGPVAAMGAAEVPAELAAGRYLVSLTNHGASGTILRQVTVTRN